MKIAAFHRRRIEDDTLQAEVLKQDYCLLSLSLFFYLPLSSFFPVALTTKPFSLRGHLRDSTKENCISMV